MSFLRLRRRGKNMPWGFISSVVCEGGWTDIERAPVLGLLVVRDETPSMIHGSTVGCPLPSRSSKEGFWT